jgi:hypothetical protein
MQTPPIFRDNSVKRLIQGAAVGAIATIIAGFTFGGWTLDSTAQKQANMAEQRTLVRVLAPICADKFKKSTDAVANLEALNKADAWRRDEIIVKAGWATFPGSEPDRGVAEPCAQLLSKVK